MKLTWIESDINGPSTWIGTNPQGTREWHVVQFYRAEKEGDAFPIDYQCYLNEGRYGAPRHDLAAAQVMCQLEEDKLTALEQPIVEPTEEPAPQARAAQDYLARPSIDPAKVASMHEVLWDHVKYIMERHGTGTFATSHEMRGVIDEEVDELMTALKAYRKRDMNNNTGVNVALNETAQSDLEHNLLDVAAVCVFMLACVRSGHLQW